MAVAVAASVGLVLMAATDFLLPSASARSARPFLASSLVFCDTEDEARRIASNIAKLPTILSKGDSGIGFGRLKYQTSELRCPPARGFFLLMSIKLGRSAASEAKAEVT